MRLLSAAWLGLGFIECTSKAFAHSIPSKSNDAHRLIHTGAHISGESLVVFLQESNTVPPAQSPSVSLTSNTSQHSHLRAQGVRKASDDEVSPTDAEGMTSAEKRVTRSGRQQNGVHPSSSSDNSKENDPSLATGSKYLAFLQEPEPNTVIFTLVGTCVVLILIIIGIITHYSLSAQNQARQAMMRGARQQYGVSAATLHVKSTMTLARPTKGTLATADTHASQLSVGTVQIQYKATKKGILIRIRICPVPHPQV